MKTCTVCGHSGPLDDFQKDNRRADGRGSLCCSCARALSAAWKKTPRGQEVKRSDDAKYYERHHEKVRAMQVGSRLKHRYGITLDDYNEMADAQDHACLICGKEEKLVVDHDHETGEVRGLLCSRCNLRLGHIEDIEWLQKALSYLGVSV